MPLRRRIRKLLGKKKHEPAKAIAKPRTVKEAEIVQRRLARKYGSRTGVSKSKPKTKFQKTFLGGKKSKPTFSEWAKSKGFGMTAATLSQYRKEVEGK